MSILGRLRRRDAPIAAAQDAAGEVAVDSFEYVRVGRTALARAAGHWPARGPAALDFTLEVSVGGEQVDAVRALVEAPRQNGRGEWRAAFPTSLDAVEGPDAAFALLAGEQRIELDPPLLRELPAGDGSWRDDHETRIREAEAGLAWLQDQLFRERERRRALEVELGAVRAEREHALSPALAAAEERYREVRYEMSRIRSVSQEALAKLEAALEDARAVAEMSDAKPSRQHEAELPAGALPCGECDATGTCQRCGGRGRRGMRTCRACAGSGGCRTCAGMGWMLEL